MAVQKKKISVTLDLDLVEALEEIGGNVSAAINNALRAEVARNKQRQALRDLIAAFEAEHGTLDTPEDEAEIQRYMSMLGGPVAGAETRAA